MICKHLAKRSYQRKAYIYCRSKKKIITFNNCKKCLKFEPRNNKPIKKKTNKLNRMERNRYSILTSDLDICWVCKTEKDLEIPSDDLHEIYPGRNRLRSIKNGFVVPLCRKCHESEEIKEKLQKICQEIYEETHTREEFINIVDKSYL